MRSFASTRGTLDLEAPPMRLYQKSKRLGTWDPRDLDFSRDVDAWQDGLFLTAWLWEEGKHTDFFRRFLDEVVGETGDLHHLQAHSPDRARAGGSLELATTTVRCSWRPAGRTRRRCPGHA